MNNKGFTLIELLIGMAIFSFSVVIVSGLLFQTVDFQDRIRGASDRKNELILFKDFMREDLAQLSFRSFEAPQNINGRSSLEWGRDINGQSFLSLVAYRKNSNTTGLQRVEYRVLDNKLYRRVWSYVDALSNQEPDEILLVTGVDNFIIDELQHTDQYAFAQTTPRSLRFELEHSDGLYNGIFLIGRNYAL